MNRMKFSIIAASLCSVLIACGGGGSGGGDGDDSDSLDAAIASTANPDTVVLTPANGALAPEVYRLEIHGYEGTVLQDISGRRLEGSFDSRFAVQGE